MEFQQAVDRRRMVRRFADRPVDPAVVTRALRNATRAPSAGFSQGWGFLVLDAPEDVERFWAASTAPGSLEEPDRWLRGMRSAPVLVVPCSDRAAYLDRYAEPDKGWTDRDEARWPVPYWHLDTAMAALLVLLTAVDADLGGCFFGIPPERLEAVAGAFAIPAGTTPIGAIALGHPEPDGGAAGSPSRRRRRPFGEVVHHGRWGRPRAES